MQAYRTLGLPCPWAPLQSVTTAASREVPHRREQAANLRGKATGPLGTAHYASGLGTHTRGCGLLVFDVGRGKPQPATKPDCSRRVMQAPCRALAEASERHCALTRMMLSGVGLWPKPHPDATRNHEWRRRARTSFATSFARTRAEARERALPRSLEIGRSLNLGDEATLLATNGRSREHPRGFPRVSRSETLRRSEVAPAPSARRMPPTSGPPKWDAGARHAAGIRRHLPWSSVPFGV
jgi:hypothetical protein